MGMSLRARARLRALHAVARVALRLFSPDRARAAVDAAARVLPPLASEDEAREADRVLASSGSCLTRALAISALLPGSDVAIGADPARSARLRAHAWVEMNDRPVTGTDGLEVDRIASLRSGRRPADGPKGTRD
jgi:hypothetical protein